VGAAVSDATGAELGTCAGIFTDDPTGEVEWLDVELATGGRVIVPVDDATEVSGAVRVGYARAVVLDAPRMSAVDRLSVEDEQRLRDHYGTSKTPKTPLAAKSPAGTGKLLPALGAAALAGTGAAVAGTLLQRALAGEGTAPSSGRGRRSGGSPGRPAPRSSAPSRSSALLAAAPAVTSTARAGLRAGARAGARAGSQVGRAPGRAAGAAASAAHQLASRGSSKGQGSTPSPGGWLAAVPALAPALGAVTGRKPAAAKAAGAVPALSSALGAVTGRKPAAAKAAGALPALSSALGAVTGRKPAAAKAAGAVPALSSALGAVTGRKPSGSTKPSAGPTAVVHRAGTAARAAGASVRTAGTAVRSAGAGAAARTAGRAARTAGGVGAAGRAGAARAARGVTPSRSPRSRGRWALAVVDHLPYGAAAWALEAGKLSSTGVGKLGRTATAGVVEPVVHGVQGVGATARTLAHLVQVALVVGAGYVLGARAGRDRYEQIRQQASALAERPQVQQVRQRVQQKLPGSSS
jgi:hypothetical protein